ncbi:hypothetical protein Neosp_002837 [[Neocosmospora] mangrovei]
MPPDASPPSQDDDHAQLVTHLQASLDTAKKSIPVFTSALARNSLLCAKLVILEQKLPGSSNPYSFLALDKQVLQKLSRHLKALLDQLDSSEILKPSLTVSRGTAVNLNLALQDERRILASCELLQLAVDRAWPQSAATIEDLIMTEDGAKDQVDDALVRVEYANKLCARFQRVYDLLGRRHHQSHKSKLAFRSCLDFRLSEKSDKTFDECHTLNLSEDQKVLTQFVLGASELAQKYRTVPEQFLSLKEVLHAGNSENLARTTMVSGILKTWSVRDIATRLMATILQAPKQKTRDSDLDCGSALMRNVVTLQYLLSESVLHLYSSSWLLDMWKPDQIEFSKDGSLLDFNRPYYPSQLSVDLSTTPLSEQLSDPKSYYTESFIAKFGLLLLQLQLQQAFPLEEEDENDDIWASIALDRYYHKFKESLDPIKNVVHACMRFRRHLEDLEARDKSDAFKFRMAFYKHILIPLRAICLETCPDLALGIQSSFVYTRLGQDEPGEALDTQPQEGPTPIKLNGGSSGGTSDLRVLGETMLKRPSPASSTEWFNNLDVLNEYLTADTCEGSDTYDMSRVRVAVIDSGLWEERQGDAFITYQNFIEAWNDAHKDNPQHGTNSVDLIRKVYGRADIYVAKVFQGDEADGNTSKYMAEAIKWAVSKKVDIISISAGFKDECHDELEAQIKMATAGGAAPEILVFAAASNWQNINGVACPASMTDRVIGIFCCNGGLKNSRQWNPNPRNHAANFAMLGEDVALDSGMRLLGGTSVSTALAAGLAAKLLDFSRQPDVQSWISKASREKMKTKAGMSAILKEMSRNNVNEGYECIAPWEILPADAASGIASREKVREAVCTIIKKAMKKV